MISGSYKNDAWNSNQLGITQRPERPDKLYWRWSSTIFLKSHMGLEKVKRPHEELEVGTYPKINAPHQKNASQIKKNTGRVR